MNYIKKDEFLKELRLLKQTDELSERLHLIFFEMAKKYSTINSFRNYTYIEDMISSAYENCVVMARKFDIENRDNPFAYFTTVIHRNFLNYISKEKKQDEKKWLEFRLTLEKYKYENGIDLPLPNEIRDKVNQYI